MDEELERLRAAVSCATVLEKLSSGWSLDRTASTRRALKYRRGPGEIVIINHDGRGWWDPQSDAKGDVFGLAQHLDRSLNFGMVRKALRDLVGIAPEYPAYLAERRCDERPTLPPLARWESRKRLHRGSPAWRYLAEKRGLPGCVLAAAVNADAVREGPYSSAWFAHRDNAGRLTGIEMRGPDYRGFTKDGGKTLFRLPGSHGVLTRLVVAEAPISCMSFAALERVQANTLYTATGGGMGPETITSLEALMEGLAPVVDARVVIATDADQAGDRYAERLSLMAGGYGLPVEPRQPRTRDEDWNDVLRAGEGRAVS